MAKRRGMGGYVEREGWLCGKGGWLSGEGWVAMWSKMCGSAESDGWLCVEGCVAKWRDEWLNVGMGDKVEGRVAMWRGWWLSGEG